MPPCLWLSGASSATLVAAALHGLEVRLDSKSPPCKLASCIPQVLLSS